MEKSANIIKLELRNAVIRLKRGVIEIDQFLREARGRRDACWLAGIFCEWEEVKSLLEEHEFPKEYFEDMEDIWVWEGFSASA